MPVKNLSYSSISAYQQCPRAWRFRKIDRIETPAPGRAVFGRAVHEVIETYLKAQLAGEEYSMLDGWPGVWRKHLGEGELRWIKGDTPETLLVEGQRVLKTCFNSPIRHIKPLVVDGEPAIEERIEFEVEDVPVPVTGYVDVVEADGVPADFKVVSRRWSQGTVDKELQPDFYLIGLHRKGYDVPGLRFKFYVVTPNGVQILETQRSTERLIWTLDMIRDTWRAIEAGAFPPNTSTWKCSERWCEYWGVCRG